MKTAFLIAAVFLTICDSTSAQSAITNGSYHQTIQASVPGQPGNSQVSSLAFDTADFHARFDTFDNHTDTQPYFIRGGAPGFEWVHNAGPVVRGSIFNATGGSLNYLLANPGNPNESTQFVFRFAPHPMPKIRPNQTQWVVPVTFTVTGRFALFGNLGLGVPPYRVEHVVGQGTGTLIYRRRTAQTNIKVWRQTPQAKLFLAAINLTFTAQQ